jgi:hypothetical protein
LQKKTTSVLSQESAKTVWLSLSQLRSVKTLALIFAEKWMAAIGSLTTQRKTFVWPFQHAHKLLKKDVLTV